MNSPDPVPLCVDLDGTVLRTDMVWESIARLLRRNPLYVAALPSWLLRGLACFKRHLAARVTVDVSALPLNPGFVEFLRGEQRKGRRLCLVTAADERMADAAAAHLGLFAEVIASDGRTNIRGQNKADRLVERFGERGFDYAGNSSVDLPVWAHARQALVVNAPQRLADRAAACANVTGVFDPQGPAWRSVVQALRPHQWMKNLILFVPLITAHQIARPVPLLRALWAFAAFCLAASGVYLLNDLLDLDDDRRDPGKSSRPFAAAALPISTGLAASPVLMAASLCLAWALGPSFAAVVGLYLLLSTGYSWRLKQFALLDVFCLAALYTIRLIGGHESTGVEYSFWLLVFSMFIFLSLALVKRFVELDAIRRENKPAPERRGYALGDADLIAALGSTSGYLAVLVLALYVNSQKVVVLYGRPMLLLLICPLLLYWISRVWLLAHRGRMHGDPIVFTLRDPPSYAVGLLTLAVLWAAT